MSAVEAFAAPFATPIGTPLVVAFANLSLAKSSRKTRSKSTESEGTVMVPLPADGSAY